jgi:hypothetical protein
VEPIKAATLIALATLINHFSDSLKQCRSGEGIIRSGKRFMIPQSIDTDPAAEQVQIALLRRSTIPQRLTRARSLSRTVIELSRRAIRRANPTLNEQELSILYIKYFYGDQLALNYSRYLHRASE